MMTTEKKKKKRQYQRENSGARMQNCCWKIQKNKIKTNELKISVTDLTAMNISLHKNYNFFQCFSEQRILFPFVSDTSIWFTKLQSNWISASGMVLVDSLCSFSSEGGESVVGVVFEDLSMISGVCTVNMPVSHHFHFQLSPLSSSPILTVCCYAQTHSLQQS